MVMVSITEYIDVQFLDNWWGKSWIKIFLKVTVLVTKVILELDIFECGINLWRCWVDDISFLRIFLEISQYLSC